MAELQAAVKASTERGSRLRSRIRSLPALVGTQVTLPKVGGDNAPTVIVQSPLNDPAKMKELLPKLMDAATVSEDYELLPRLNVTTAPREVLLGLPGLTEPEVNGIVSAQKSLDPADLATTTGAWVVTTGGLTAAKYAAIEKYVTGRTTTYRVHAVGYFVRGGPVARAEAVIDANPGHPRVLYFRDVSDLGRGGFDLQR